MRILYEDPSDVNFISRTIEINRRTYYENLVMHSMLSAYIILKLIEKGNINFLKNNMDWLVFTSLIHDIGKAVYADYAKERILKGEEPIFTGHELFSVTTFSELIIKKHLSPEVAYQCVRAIVLHHQALRGVRYEDFERMRIRIRRYFVKRININKLKYFIKVLLKEKVELMKEIYNRTEIVKELLHEFRDVLTTLSSDYILDRALSEPESSLRNFLPSTLTEEYLERCRMVTGLLMISDNLAVACSYVSINEPIPMRLYDYYRFAKSTGLDIKREILPKIR